MSKSQVDAPDAKIVVTKDGPYAVHGAVPLAIQVITPNAEGFSWDWVQGPSFKTDTNYELCRCGHSHNKPFCDGSHTQARFHGRETASRAPYDQQAERIDGPTLSLSDAEALCAFARFCDPGTGEAAPADWLPSRAFHIMPSLLRRAAGWLPSRAFRRGRLDLGEVRRSSHDRTNCQRRWMDCKNPPV